MFTRSILVGVSILVVVSKALFPPEGRGQNDDDDEAKTEIYLLTGQVGMANGKIQDSPRWQDPS